MYFLCDKLWANAQPLGLNLLNDYLVEKWFNIARKNKIDQCMKNFIQDNT